MKKTALFSMLIIAGMVSVQQFSPSLAVAEDSASEAQSSPQGPIPVTVEAVQADSEVVTQDLPGRVSAYRLAQVRARVTGIIEKRVFDEGTHVDAGEVLFKIEDRTLKATHRARKADVANAVAAYNLSQQTLKRYKQLLSMGAVSRQEYDTNAAQSQQSKAQVEQAKANLEIAKINLDYATVTAPISGRIDKALVTEGALTSAESTQLANIEQIDKVYIDFTRTSADVIRIRQAMNAGLISGPDDKNIEINLGDGTIYPEKGQLEFSSMEVDEATGAISLRAVVDNPDFVLLPGMFVRVKVPVATTNNVIKVPQKAVNITPKGPEVYMVKDSKLVPVKIELGPMTGEYWFVRSGLNHGDRVVVSDTSILKTMAGAQFVGMTSAEMQDAGMTAKQQ
ncbi:efflux RND transporter periplasmic adaptor subunit [Motiliproteus coralliicola]|uniref:Efflux RND transporter periplasmic adaptor subunit n=1 Tax=Motiliproteus coralliicola TaxID=2283196 RepID=A0A369WVD9_9GAMM|nr:efflux RND transporter periplasmic adaptor subunit [Motiliproteus coralliicola]RDE24514.1 efflux RND transporter periplasmic adaptor subunit [Motiliproteus coralliicola]